MFLDAKRQAKPPAPFCGGIGVIMWPDGTDYSVGLTVVSAFTTTNESVGKVSSTQGVSTTVILSLVTLSFVSDVVQAANKAKTTRITNNFFIFNDFFCYYYFYPQFYALWILALTFR